MNLWGILRNFVEISPSYCRSIPIMHRTPTIPFLPQGKRKLKVRKALFCAVVIALLLLCAYRFCSIFFIPVIPHTTPHFPSITTKTGEEYNEEEDALRQQLRRTRDVANWRVLGNLESTGEAMYEDEKAQKMLKNEANIAFFLQVAQSNILLTPRLLSRIWHPNNIYCIHFDSKIPLQQIDMFKNAIRSNQKLSNVIILPSTPVTYAGISMLLNTLESMHILLTASQKWNYYINLSGSDYPLVSVTGLRRLLGRLDVLNSSTSFIHFSANKALWDELAFHRLGTLHFDLSLGFDQESDEDLIETKIRHPVLEPGNLRIQIAKGESWIIGHRKFCSNAVHGNFGRRLLTLFANMQSSPEHFFQTLAWNDRNLNRTVARHSFREVLWNYDGKHSHQHPYYLDERSSHGAWEMWHVLAHSPNFFARKFRIPDSNLMDHIDIHKSGATDMIANLTAVSQSFRIVKNRFSCVADIDAPMSRAYIMPCFWSGWRERECRTARQELCVDDFVEPPY